jgi:hypothetical protein
MSKWQTPLGHHVHQVAQTQLVAKIPAHAENDHLTVAVSTGEQPLHAPKLAHRPLAVSSARYLNDSLPLFAPEYSGPDRDRNQHGDVDLHGFGEVMEAQNFR